VGCSMIFLGLKSLVRLEEKVSMLYLICWHYGINGRLKFLALRTLD
jgi:hypothetical protein